MKRVFLAVLLVVVTMALGVFLGINLAQLDTNVPPDTTPKESETVDPAIQMNANLSQSVTLEAGAATLRPEDFLVNPKMEMTVAFDRNTSLDLSVPGEYPVVIICNGAYSFERTVKIVDTTAPEAEPRDVYFFLSPIPQPEDFVAEINDVSDVTVTFSGEPDLTVAGEQEVVILLTDAWGNSTELTAMLTVELDTQAPEIHGVKDIQIYQGDAVAYRSGITVTDNADPAPRLTVDSSQVDLSAVGTYKVIYTATDASGNQSSQEAVITVKEKKEGYADMATIYKMADELLEDIVNDSMTKREKVEAVYRWIRRNVWYSGHSDKSDWLQGAYVAMNDRAGDCFNYFALGKLFLERMGIDNLDVVKVKNYEGDSSHFWSMVSLDDGQTWYHFDTTPRVGEGDNFCLVTDAFLDSYSRAHNNCFNRDKSLYPKTPEE